MNRRTFLATLPATALGSVFAGCAARLGLADRVEITRKVVEVTDSDGTTHLLADKRYDDANGPFYDREPHEELLDGDGPDEALTVPESTSTALQSEFDAVRYGIRGCEGASEEAAGRDCRETWLFLDDFNDVDVGDVVDVRFGDELSGIVDVHERRHE